MGQALPFPVKSVIVERHALKDNFQVAVAEMNGWRTRMEDAHVIHMKPGWAFFGVYDGHGGEQCSIWVAQEFRKRLENDGCPEDDAAVKAMCLDIDEAFLNTELPSGSTGAMCIVHRPDTPEGKLRLRVANAGDSRVLLGRRNGEIIDGNGTEQGLSTDHKPNHPPERERIYRCGGHVKEAYGGVFRVNGDLAVSRGFGDAEYKKTGGPGPEDRPVTADPELGSFECDLSDFLVIVCDGVSEGDFPNPEVIQLIADELKEHGDPGVAARKVILKAEERNSKDNITCMIILFDNISEEKQGIDFIPGPLEKYNERYYSAYESMAKRAELSLYEAMSRRYDQLLSIENRSDKEDAELAQIEKDEKPGGDSNCQERFDWFQEWHERRRKDSIMPQQQEVDGRIVKAPLVDILKKAVEEHSELTWDDRMKDFAGQEGIVQQEDEKDNTMRVKFNDLVAWLPTEILTVVDRQWPPPEGYGGDNAEDWRNQDSDEHLDAVRDGDSNDAA